MTITSLVVGFLLSITVIVGFFACISLVFKFGLYDLILNGLNILVDLFGTTYTIILMSLFIIAFMVLIIRFVMSWLGENPGHSANS